MRKPMVRSQSVGIALLGLVMLGCAGPELTPFDPAAIRRIQTDRTAENQPRALEPMPTALRAPWVPPSTMPAGGRSTSSPAGVGRSPAPTTRDYPEAKVRLSLQQAVHRAVAFNPDVRVASFDPAISEARVIEAEARFDPTFFSQYQYQKTASQLSFNPLDPSESRSHQVQAGLRQVMPTGTQLELKYQATRTDVENAAFTFTNPFYQTDVTLQLTHPLLRDSGQEVNRARIAIARNDQRISGLEFRLKVEEQIARLEEAYWRLVQAYREVEIQEDVLGLTRETARILEERLQGDVSHVQLWQAYSAIRQRELQLVRAKARVRDASDLVKQLMGDPNLPVAGGNLVVPSDAPLNMPIKLDVADQIAAALEHRAELAQQSLRIDSSGVIARAARNNRLPQLNLIGSIGLQGLGGGWDDATSSQFQTDIVNYAVGLSFEVPIGNRSANAIWQRTLLQRQQAIAQYQSFVEAVSLEVKRAQRDVETAWAEMVAAGDAARAAQKSLDAIQAREVGEALTFSWIQLKLERQGALAEAQRAELNARVSYNIAISALERTKGTLLRYNNVVLREEPSPFAVR